jgi:hypothetical protein
MIAVTNSPPPAMSVSEHRHMGRRKDDFSFLLPSDGRRWDAG